MNARPPLAGMNERMFLSCHPVRQRRIVSGSNQYNILEDAVRRTPSEKQVQHDERKPCKLQTQNILRPAVNSESG